MPGVGPGPESEEGCGAGGMEEDEGVEVIGRADTVRRRFVFSGRNCIGAFCGCRLTDRRCGFWLVVRLMWRMCVHFDRDLDVRFAVEAALLL